MTELPPLPEPRPIQGIAGRHMVQWGNGYTAADVRAYAAEAVRVALEQAARNVDVYAESVDGYTGVNFRNCAAGIRALKGTP